MCRALCLLALRWWESPRSWGSGPSLLVFFLRSLLCPSQVFKAWPRFMESGLAGQHLSSMYPWRPGWQFGGDMSMESNYRSDRPKTWALRIDWFGDVFSCFVYIKDWSATHVLDRLPSITWRFKILRLQPNPGGFGGGRSDSTQDFIDLSRVEQFSTDALTGVCAVWGLKSLFDWKVSVSILCIWCMYMVYVYVYVYGVCIWCMCMCMCMYMYICIYIHIMWDYCTQEVWNLGCVCRVLKIWQARS